MGARQELVEEIKREANVDFHMYSSERFLSYGQTFLKEKINQQALDEIHAMKKAELEELNKLEVIKRHIKHRDLLREEAVLMRRKIEEIDSKILQLRSRNEQLFKDSIESDNIKEYLHSMSIHESELLEEKSQLMQKLEMLQKSSKIESGHDDLLRIKLLKYLRDNRDEGVK